MARNRYLESRERKMREYKFRGKSVYTGKWVYGFYLEQDTYSLGSKNTKRDLLMKNAGIIVENSKCTSGTIIYKETLGQYTGLKDRNMKEIYEGDIVKRSLRDKENNKIFFEDFYVIIFEKATFQYKGIREYYISETGEKWRKKEKEIYRQNLGSNFGVDIKDIEVIGNIYDNPELLEEGE